MPLKIMHIIASNFYGGPEKQVTGHLRRLDPSHYVGMLAAFDPGEGNNEILTVAARDGIWHHDVPMTGPFDFLALGRLCQIMRLANIDLVCAHGYKANILSRITTWRLAKPLVLVSRGWTGENAKVRFYEWLDKLFLRLADHVIAVSEGQRKKILHLGLAPEKVSVIHNAIDLDTIPSGYRNNVLREELGLSPETLLVATAGRLSPEKNHVGMIEAAGLVVRRLPGVAFVIFGEGFLRPELEKRILEQGLAGNFFLPGFRRDLQQLLHEIDIFMLPSFSEGLPNVVLEAFAAKKPVVASRVGGTPEVVQDNVSGFLAHPRETTIMAERIMQLCQDEALRRSMGEAGYAQVKLHFDFAVQTKRYEEIYTGILARWGKSCQQCTEM